MLGIKKEYIYPLFCLSILAISFILSAIKPLYLLNWILEISILFIFTFIFIFTYKKFRFSNLSYTLILIFSIFQLIGAHYTFSNTPIGFWIQDIFDFSRNNYDRIVHFLSGLLLYFPILEIYRRILKHKKDIEKSLLIYTIPVFILIAIGAIFEIIEWGIASISQVDLASAYLGAQGDIADAQKDLALDLLGGFIGSVITMFIVYFKKSKIKK